MKLTSYWTDTAPRFAAGEQGALGGKVDVAIVGGGFTGLSAALALARRGASVVVLEADRVASAASGRNGGHCNNGFSHDFGALARRFGVEPAAALYHAYDRGVHRVEQIVRDEGIDCFFRRTGKIKLAVKPAHYENMARGFDLLQRAADPEAILVPPSRIAEEVASPGYHGGIVLPKSAQMHMGLFGKGLADAAVRAGARIFEAAEVRSLKRLGGRAHRLQTSRGTIEAAQVFWAAGAGRRAPFFFRRRLIPIGSFIVATEALDDARIDAIMPRRRNGVTTANVGNYFRISPDNRLIFGGRTRFALSSPTSDAKSGRMLEKRLGEVFPALSGTRIDYCWGGIVDLTADRLPRAGEQDGLLYSVGYSGHGVQMSIEMGQRMAAIMSGQRLENPLADMAWPAVPGHFGPAWFMPLVGLYYRAKDVFS